MSAPTTRVLGGITWYKPPKGFNPLTATIAELQKYHIPLPPGSDKSSVAYQTWENIFKHAVHFNIPSSVTPLSPDLFIKSTNSSGPINTIQQGPSWSGLVQSVPFASSIMEGVEGQWTMPWAGDPQGDEPAYSSTWVGLGGTAGDLLVQCGTDSAIETGGGGAYGMWTMSVNPSTHQVQGGSITSTSWQPKPGDQIFSKVTWTPGSLSGSGTANFLILDITQDQTYVGSMSVAYGGSIDPVTADWITERPVGRNSNGTYTLPYLAGFGTLQWTECQDSLNQNNWYIPTHFGNYDANEMTTINGKTDMADASNLTVGSDGTGSFINQFHNQGYKVNNYSPWS